MSNVVAFGFGIVIGALIMFSGSWYFWKSYYRTMFEHMSAPNNKIEDSK